MDAPVYDPTRPEWKAFVAEWAAGDLAAAGALADWLDDQYADRTGHCALGEFVRGSLDVQRHEPDNHLGLLGWKARARPGTAWFQAAVTAQYGFLRTWASWELLFAGLPRPWAQRWRFRGGRPETVVCGASHWYTHGRRVMSIAPVDTLLLPEVPHYHLVRGINHHQITLTVISPHNRLWNGAPRTWPSYMIKARDWADMNEGQRVRSIHAALEKLVVDHFPPLKSCRIDVSLFNARELDPLTAM